MTRYSCSRRPAHSIMLHMQPKAPVVLKDAARSTQLSSSTTRAREFFHIVTVRSLSRIPTYLNHPL